MPDTTTYVGPGIELQDDNWATVCAEHPLYSVCTQFVDPEPGVTYLVRFVADGEFLDERGEGSWTEVTFTGPKLDMHLDLRPWNRAADAAAAGYEVLVSVVKGLMPEEIGRGGEIVVLDRHRDTIPGAAAEAHRPSIRERRGAAAVDNADAECEASGDARGVGGPLLAEDQGTSCTLFHVTTAAAFEQIRVEGLRPAIRERAAAAGETEAVVYLFPNRVSAEDAVSMWLGDEFDEDEELVLVEVRVPAHHVLASEVDWEVTVAVMIGAADIVGHETLG